jgi:hypothetical protein
VARTEPIVVQQPGVTLRVNGPDDVEILGESGKALVHLTGFQVMWTPRLDSNGGTVRRITAEDGQPGVEVSYTWKQEDVVGFKAIGRFVVYPQYVAVRYDLTDVKLEKGMNIGGCMFGRRAGDGVESLDVVKLGRWTRHDGGGVPYEVYDGSLLPYALGEERAVMAFDTEFGANFGWKNSHAHHLNMRQQDDGHYRGQFGVIVPPKGWSMEAVSARWHERPLGLSLSTPKVYNWWSDPNEPMQLTAAVSNATQQDREARIAYWVRDFAGNTVAGKTHTIRLPKGGTHEEHISFAAPEARGIYFAEVSAIDASTGEEVFSRTNLALMPPHEFKSTPDDSIFGIAAYWPIPSEEAVQNLMDRMGVRWVREGDTRKQHPGRLANHHSNAKFGKPITEAERDAWIKQQLSLCIERQNPYWEFGNEINMSTMGIAMEGGGIGKALLAPSYVEWVKAVHRVQQETGMTQVKLLSVGVAGMDVPFVEKVHELGAWDLLHGLCIHPGRGNFTADYPIKDPADPNDLGWEGANFWNYYGAVRKAGALIDKFGKMPLWLTEVYTPTYPNSSWEDTPRNATENVVLSYALAKAEGVKCGMYYQLFDTVHYNKLGVNPKDREYFFGLVRRDLSFKPTVLAYCAVAEELDQATFRGWGRLANADTRCLLFDTPRGPLAILWTRADGYVLTERTPDFVTPEPWIDTWKTKTPTTLAAAANSVTVINSIGQRTERDAADGTVTIALDGAPRMVYGLDVEALTR